MAEAKSEKFETKVNAYVTELVAKDESLSKLPETKKNALVKTVSAELVKNYHNDELGKELDKSPDRVPGYNKLTLSQQAQVDIMAMKETDYTMRRLERPVPTREVLLGVRDDFADQAVKNTAEFGTRATNLREETLQSLVRPLKEKLEKEADMTLASNAKAQVDKLGDLSHLPKLQDAPGYNISQKGGGSDLQIG